MKSYLIFEEVGRSDSGKTKIIDVKNNDDVYLGSIKWKPGWRSYVFLPYEYTIFDRKCLAEIADYLNKLVLDKID